MARAIPASTASAPAQPTALGDTAADRPFDDLPPIVSPQWLEAHADAEGLIVVDVRSADEYAVGHIESSVNIPFEIPVSAWITMRDELLLELPEPAELKRVLGENGISKDSRVVIVSTVGQPPYPQAGGTRAAVTLEYVGLGRVAVLDGGYPRWVAERRPTTTRPPRIVPVDFDPTVDDRAFVGIDQVRDRLGRSLIVDARDADVYSGDVAEPWADKAGHIPSAISLPAVSIWNADGTYKSASDLGELARRALGDDAEHKEVVVYCGVGGYATSWLYVLTRVLGYRDVKMYDGSAQEWVRHEDMQR